MGGKLTARVEVADMEDFSMLFMFNRSLTDVEELRLRDAVDTVKGVENSGSYDTTKKKFGVQLTTFGVQLSIAYRRNERKASQTVDDIIKAVKKSGVKITQVETGKQSAF